MSSRNLIGCAFLLLAINPVVWAAAPEGRAPVPRDFAYYLPLTISGQGAVYELSLPDTIYRAVTRRDLGDIRVFNGKDEIVPHAVRRPANRDLAAVEPEELPFFPIHARRSQDLDTLAIQVRRNRHGHIIDIKNRAGGRGQQVVAYLLDLSRLNQAVQALNLSWLPSDKGFIRAVNVAKSNDLRRWQRLATKATVASLKVGGHRLERRSIKLGDVRARYLRLSWPGKTAPFRLDGVQAVPANRYVERPRHWAALTAQLATDKPGEYVYDLGGLMPIDRIRVSLPERNTLVSAQLFSRNGPDQAWAFRAGGLLYRLTIGGKSLNNADFIIRPAGARYWRLVVDRTEGGVGRSAPSLVMGWLPQQLVFVARGQGPFKLAYGSARPTVQPTASTVDSLLQRYRSERGDDLGLRPARPGVPRTLSGLTALQPPPPPVPWKKWLLWLILGAGVVLLGWMAWRLLHQLEPPPERPDEGNKKPENNR